MRTIASAGLACLVAVLGGCGASNLSVEITQPLRFTPPTAAGPNECTVDSGGTTYDAYGTMDVSYKAYTDIQPFLMTNNMSSKDPSGSGNKLLGASYEGEKLDLSYLGTDDATTSALAGITAQVPVSIIIPPDGGTWYGPLTLIPANVGQKIASVLSPGATPKTVVVRFHVEGKRKDGLAVSSSVYQYPVEVCSGCIAKCKSTSTQPMAQAYCYFPGQAPTVCVASK